MVIDCAQYRILNSNLFRFCNDNRFSEFELRLLLFWSRHPRAKLSLYTIANTIDTIRMNLRGAISSLVKKSILVEEHNSNTLTTYYLKRDQNIQEHIEELAQMNCYQIKILEKQLQGGAILD